MPTSVLDYGWSAADIPNQQGRIALRHRSNSGLGLETARALKRRGATVVLGRRSPRKAEIAKQVLLRGQDGERWICSTWIWRT